MAQLIIIIYTYTKIRQFFVLKLQNSTNKKSTVYMQTFGLKTNIVTFTDES